MFPTMKTLTTVASLLLVVFTYINADQNIELKVNGGEMAGSVICDQYTYYQVDFPYNCENLNIQVQSESSVPLILVSQSTQQPSVNDFTWSSFDALLLISASDPRFSRGVFYLAIHQDCTATTDTNTTNPNTTIASTTNTTDPLDYTIEISTRHVSTSSCSEGLQLHQVVGIVIGAIAAAGIFAGCVFTAIHCYRQVRI